jgi:hypothetical protein
MYSCNFLWCIPKSEISGSYSSSIFSVLRNLHTVLLQWTDVHPTSSLWELLCLYILISVCYFGVFLIRGILTRVQGDLIVIATWISLMLNDIEYFYVFVVILLLRCVYTDYLPIFISIFKLYKKVTLWYFHNKHNMDFNQVYLLY